MFEVRTARLILRDLVSEDKPFIQRMAREPAITRYQSWLRLDTEEAVQQWVENVVFHNRQQPRDAYNLIIREAGAGHAIGWIGWGHSDVPQYGDYSFGYALLPSYWGRGYMTEALQAGLAFLFGTLGAHAVTDCCESGNVGSRRVMEKAGMRLATQWTEETDSGDTVEYLRFVIQAAEWRALLTGPVRQELTQ
jgi:ribosomal-protein-alanine N-acetyltransferase